MGAMLTIAGQSVDAGAADPVGAMAVPNVVSACRKGPRGGSRGTGLAVSTIDLMTVKGAN